MARPSLGGASRRLTWAIGAAHRRRLGHADSFSVVPQRSTATGWGTGRSAEDLIAPDLRKHASVRPPGGLCKQGIGGSSPLGSTAGHPCRRGAGQECSGVVLTRPGPLLGMARWASGSRLERSSTAERLEGLEAGAGRVGDVGRRAGVVWVWGSGAPRGGWVADGLVFPRQC